MILSREINIVSIKSCDTLSTLRFPSFRCNKHMFNNDAAIANIKENAFCHSSNCRLMKRRLICLADICVYGQNMLRYFPG